MDFLLAWWFFRPIEPAGQVPVWKRFAGYLIFLLLLPMYLYAMSYRGGVADTLLRFLLRAAVYIGYVYLVKGRSWSCCLYFGVLAWLLFTTANCILITPTFYQLQGEEVWVAQIMEAVVAFVVLTLFSRLVPMSEIAVIGSARLAVMTVLVVVQLYVKASMGQMLLQFQTEDHAVLTSYPLILQVLLLCAVLFFEWYQHSQYVQKNALLSDVANRYRYEYAQVSADAAASLRQVHHDLKNHLAAIQRLAANSNQDVVAYVQSLAQDLGEYESLVQTGNELLDGLLTHKIRLARGQEIPISVNVDFSAGGFIQEKDICALFGNALDNALEASAGVTELDRRSILVKCGVKAGNLILMVSNYYEGELVQVGVRLVSR